MDLKNPNDPMFSTGPHPAPEQTAFGQHQKRKNIAIFLLLLVILAAAIVFGVNVLFQKGFLANKKPASVQTGAGADLKTIINERGSMTQLQTITIPLITHFSTIGASEVPSAIKLLLASGAENVEYRSVTYASGQSGYQIFYIVPNKSVTDFGDQLYQAVNSQWKIVGGARTNNYGFMELQGLKSGDVARAVFYTENKNIKVNIQIVNAK